MFLLLGFCVLPVNALAKETPAGLDQTALKSLAQEFVSKIGGRLKAYDENQARQLGVENPLSQVPEGELLLLRPRAGKFIMDTELGTIKHNGQLYYSLPDIIDRLELAIDFDPQKKTGSGWFLREDWLIRFDFVKGEVVSRNQSYTVAPDDIYEEGDFYISAKAAKTWLAVDTTPDISQQYVEIRTPYPFPALARNERENGFRSGRTRNVAVLPRLKREEKWVDINTAEIQENVRYSKTRANPGRLSHQNIVTAEGDLLKHSFYGVSFYDNEQKLSSVRARLTKEEEDATLLGPLKARSYSLGDVDIAPLPLTGSTTQEFGFRVNNNPLRNADFQSTTISGDSLPGWDVELYRDGVLIDRLRVDEDARYEFPQIDLFAGDNLFEVFFYGPQGEIRRDGFNIPVNEAFLTTQDNTYDVSVSLADTQLYQKLPSEDEDQGAPDIIARYNKIIGTTLTYAGVRARQIDGEQKGYLTGGFTNIWNGFIFDGNFASDQKGSLSSQLGIRKNIDEWQLALRANAQDEEFDNEGETSNVFGLTGNASKNFITFLGTFATVTANAQYNERVDNSTEKIGSLSVSHQIGRFSLSTTTTYRNVTFGDTGDNFGTEKDQTFVDDSITGRYSMGRFYVRGGVNLNVKPEKNIDNYFTQLTYQPTNKFSTDLLLEHDPDERLSEARLNLNYRHEKFRISPFASIDTDHRFQTGVRLTTALVDEPGKTLPQFTSDRVVGRGLVSSFVYFDKNGNSVFDGDDEPLPDVYVESVNIKRREKTNDKGYSLIKDLPESFVTDIHIDKTTLPDPFMIPGFEGVSVFPRPGQMVDITFPVHLSGEIDGTVSVQDRSVLTNARRVTVNLIPVDGKSSDVITTLTADDGYYVMSNIRPGDYLLNVNPVDAADLRAGGIAPVPVKIGYDGTVLSGQNFTLQKGRVQVPFTIKPYKGNQYVRPFFALETGRGTQKSPLASLLEKMIEQRASINAEEGLAPIALEGEQELKVLPGQDFNAHYQRCQMLNDGHIPCGMVLFVPSKNAGGAVTAQK